MRRLCTISLVLLLLAGCGGRGGPGERPRAQATPIEVLAVAPGSLTATVAAAGTVKARDDVPISAEVGGQVTAVLVKVGDRVEKGQTLVRLDSELAALAAKQAEAQLLLAEVDQRDAQSNLRRAEVLRENEDISEAEFEASQRAATAARAGFMSAEAAHGSAARQLRNTRISSPIAGVVAFVQAEVGHLIPIGAPVARVVNDSQVEVEFGLNEDQIVNVGPGRPAEIRVRAYPGLVFEGRVEYVGPRADDMTKTYPVRVLLANHDSKLRSGMVAEITVATAEMKDVIVIERDWVVDRYGEPVVFVAADSLAHIRKIALGSVVGDRVVVTSGLETGDLLVTLGYDQLSDGARIDIRSLP
jgi:membrane fusion protein (multidrug efflux system)